MFRNYVKTAVRNLMRSWGGTAIKSTSLVVGCVFFILVGLYIREQVRYDRFYDGADRVHRIVADVKIGKRQINAPLISGPVGPTFTREQSAVETYTRLLNIPCEVQRESSLYFENDFYYADSTFFDVFPLPLTHGEAETALQQPNSIVLTTEMAQKYFGENNPVGKTITVGPSEYTVTGVLGPVMDDTHLHFDFLASLQSFNPPWKSRWVTNKFYTYLKLSPGTSQASVEDALPGFVEEHLGPRYAKTMGTTFDAFLESGGRFDLSLQAANMIHLTSDLEFEMAQNTSLTFLYVVGLLGLLMLLVACINYVNLTTARASERGKEIGLRKTVGADRRMLRWQFLGETLLIVFFSVAVGAALAELFLPVLNQTLGLALETNYLRDPLLPLSLVLLALVVGLAAGAYPAFRLSRLRPILTLRGGDEKTSSGISLRDVLVVFQFALSLILVIGAFVINQQVQHLTSRDIGMRTDSVLVMQRTQVLGNDWGAFRREVQDLPGVTHVAGTSTLPGQKVREIFVRSTAGAEQKKRVAWFVQASPAFFEASDIQLVEGASYAERSQSAGLNEVWINEAAAERLPSENPVGKPLIISEQPRKVTIAGIFENVHLKSLRSSLRPTIVRAMDAPPKYVYVKYDADNSKAVIESLRQKWEAFLPSKPFIYSYMSDEIDAMYEREQQFGSLSTYCTLFTILIACMGIWGLASFVVDRRTREVAVRKTVGASSLQVTRLLLRRFFGIAGIAFVISAPVAWYGLQQWLQQFPYRVDVGLATFAGAGGFMIVLLAINVSYHTYRIASTDPAVALRSE